MEFKTTPDTISAELRARATRHPQRPAFHYGHRTISYGELDERASRVAQALRSVGIGPGDRFAHLDVNSPDYFELLYGAARVGATLASLNWRLAPPELLYVLNHSQARVLVVGAEFLGAIQQIRERLEHVEHVFVAGRHPSTPAYADWIEQASADDLDERGTPDSPAVQYYTSGTTGRPKGAMLSNRNLLAVGARFAPMVGLSESSVLQAAMPLFHISGSAVGLCGIQNGCTTVLLPAADLEAVLSTIERFEVTHTVLVPAVVQALLASPQLAATDLRSLEFVIYGGSPISQNVLRQAIDAFGCRFLQVYGLTESTGGVVALPPEDHQVEGPRSHRLSSAGKPFPGHEVKVVDPATCQPRASNQVGEIWIRGEMVMLGYANDDDATQEALVEGGWLRTGDAGYMDADGYLYIQDRVKDMIISGGENVYPAEVENVLMAHPTVQDVAVIGVPHPRWGETVKAVVVAAPGTDATEDALTAHCRDELAHYKCPTSVDFVDELPRNPTGKVLKYRLRDQYRGDPQPAGRPATPSEPCRLHLG